MKASTPRAVIFVGPSVPEALRPRLEGVEERPPVRRGDLTALDGIDLVGIVDGEFHQSLSVAPREVLALLKRGVKVLGASSMGALRAAELSSLGMEGIGVIFEMFRSERIASDDEVAICFHPDTHRPLSEPLVNVRCAADALLGRGEIEEDTARAIVEEAVALPFPDRVYRRILANAGRRMGKELGPLSEAFAAHDQKRLDALKLYARVAELLQTSVQEAP